MIVLFLDVDGVLNNRAAFAASTKGGSKVLDEACIVRLARLVKACESVCKTKIVLSSTWRLYGRHVNHLKRQLRKHGLRIHAMTDSKGPVRGDEIQRWLDANPVDCVTHHGERLEMITTNCRFVILDDDSDMLPEQLSFFVQTNMDTGLTDAHVMQAMKILEIPVDDSAL